MSASPPEPDRHDGEKIYTERVRVTSPLGSAARHVSRSVRQEIDESTGVGEVYMRSLIRSQFRAALTVVSTLILSLGVLPLAFITIDASTTTSLWGVPLPWIILGFAVYPCIVLIGWLYVRQAERAERDFIDLVENESDSSSGPGPQ